MALQNSINRQVSDARLDAIAAEPNPASVKNIQLNSDGTIGFADPGSGGGGSSFDSWRLQPVWANDFIGLTTGAGTAYMPFVGAAVSAGTIAAPNAGLVTRSHPGVVRFRSSTTANSGYTVGASNTLLLLGGGEIFECIFNIATLTNGTFRIGFIDTITSADCVDGCYFEISASGAVVAKTANNNNRTPSSTLFTAATGTWYRARVSLNTAATEASFAVTNDAGTLLGSTTITSNIPTAVGRETGAGIIATNSGTVATDLLHLDYMAFAATQELVR